MMPMGYTVPSVIELTARGERSMDIFSRLMRERIIILGTEIDEDAANIIIAQLVLLDSENPEKDITMYINSPGGSVYDGMAIYDTMQFVRSDVVTICTGQAASMASFLLAAGTKGKRMVLPTSRVMIHQIMGGTRGQAKDIEIYAAETRLLEDTMHELFSQHTGQPVSKIAEDMDRDFYMSPEEAVKYGICDKVVTRVEEALED
jgi:ATP-dependent Clp protease protease subunit